MKSDKNKIQGKKIGGPSSPLLRKVRHFDRGKISPTSATNGVLAQKMDQNVLKWAQKGLEINLAGLKIVFLY